MAKKSSVENNERRRKLVKKFAGRRAAGKGVAQEDRHDRLLQMRHEIAIAEGVAGVVTLEQRRRPVARQTVAGKILAVAQRKADQQMMGKPEIPRQPRKLLGGCGHDPVSAGLPCGRHRLCWH